MQIAVAENTKEAAAAAVAVQSLVKKHWELKEANWAANHWEKQRWLEAC